MAKLTPLHGFALRSEGEECPIPVLFSALREVTKVFPLSTVTVGGGSRAFSLTHDSLADLLSTTTAKLGGLHFTLGDPGRFCAISYALDRSYAPRIYSTLSWQLGETQPGLTSRDEIIGFFSSAAAAFGASLGGLYHPDQKKIMLHEVLTGDTGGIIPPPAAVIPTLKDLDGVSLEVLHRLSAMTHPRNFDRARIPESVWWVNYWDEQVVEMVGVKLVETTPWFEVKKEGSARVLIATELPPRLTDASGTGQLAEICAQLRIRQLQEANTQPV